MRVGYFTNQYPSVTHTFVRREILALEARGIEVFRYALRSGNDLIDAQDRAEEARTRHVLDVTAFRLLICCASMLVLRPGVFFAAFRDTIKIGWRSDRGVLRHLAYFVEATMLASWCRRDNIRHLHAHFGTNSAAIAMIASKISGVPYSFTAHGPDEFERATLLSLGAKLEHSSFAVCVSSFGKSQLMRWTRPDQWNKIEVVHCGVDNAFFGYPMQPPPAVPRLVCVGRLSEQKAQLVLVDAARKLHEDGVQFEIVLAGDGPMRAKIEEAIERGGLQRKISIIGWASGERVRAEILASRALILPSFSENMPVVIMEALALGRPVISTYVAGIPELVQPGKTGWLVPAGDEIALAQAMRDALAAPVEQLAAMGAAGRLHVIEHHDTAKEVSKLKELFEGV